MTSKRKRRFSGNGRNPESGVAFSSLLSRGMFDEEELIDALKVSSSIMNRDSLSAPRQPLPPAFIIAKTKRIRAWECDGHAAPSGHDHADIFEHQISSDRDASMQTSSTSRRRSSMDKGSDSHEPTMSFMSSADPTPENPSKMDDTPEFREKNNRSSASTSIGNSNSNSSSSVITNCNIISSNSNEKRVPSTVTRCSSTRKVIGNRMDCVNHDVNAEATSFDSNAPSTANVEENKKSDNNTSDGDEQDSRNEDIDKIGAYDIICGRNNGAHNWVGNRRFRVTILMHLKKYTDASTRDEKIYVIKSVIDLLLDKDGVGARFIKKIGEGKYERLRDKQIREKVGHAFREMHALEQKGVDGLVAKCF